MWQFRHSTVAAIRHTYVAMSQRSKRSRSTSSKDDAPPAKSKSKHRLGYNMGWTTTFPWHVPVHAEKGNPTSDVIGLLCSLCQRHNTRPRNGTGTWVDTPCASLRTDVLQRHKASDMHREAEKLEHTRLASQRDGGIRQAISAHTVVHREALIGSLQILYWLVKDEVAHTTNTEGPSCMSGLRLLA